MRRRELGAILECVTFVADVELDIAVCQVDSSLSGGSDHPIDSWAGAAHLQTSTWRHFRVYKAKRTAFGSRQ